ncbi:MAG: ABC transporter ATP-binding protein [Phycisphaerales bacterium]|nr:ABC transporter ATP-binding protein [Phycisphaerales bacterium]
MSTGPSSRQLYRAYLARRSTPKPETTGAAPVRRRSRSFAALFRALWREIGPRRPMLAASLGTLTIATLLGLAMPASTKFALDYILLDAPGPEGLPAWLPLPRDRMSLLWWLSGAMLCVTALSIAIGMWGRWQTTRTAKRLHVGVRRRAFAHAARLPLHRVQHLKSGGLASILRDDAGQAGELVFSLIYNPWRAVVQLVGTLAILALVDWRLLLGALLVIPTVWLTHRTWIARLRPVWRDVRQTRQGIDAHATETFAGMRVVRAFAREGGEAARFTTGNALLARQQMLNWWWSRGIEIVWQLLIPVASAAVLLYGGWQVVRGNLTVGDLMMFSAYLLMLLAPVETLVMSAANVQDQLAALDRVLDLLDEPREFHDQGARPRLPAAGVRGAIAFDHVSYRYPSRDGLVLDDIVLEVPAGSTVALVGPSGSGKTTLCNLAARFFDPSSGRVLLDGRDLRDYDVRSYRELLGVVEQDVFLFDGTVRDNIAYARREASEAEIIGAARDAHAEEFILTLDKGFDTVIGERGVRLSGGQRQRLAIARALLADPRILILDEATSNLDTQVERLIQQALGRLMRSRTCFVIAHRLSTIRHADLIAVLERGRIVETGAHGQLLARGGLYAAFLRMQIEAPPAPPAGEPAPSTIAP